MENHRKINVSSEVGTLERLLIHSPDEGIGKVIPTKAQDWLFEDIIHVDTMRKKEYDLYLKILLYFLDYENIHPRINEIDSKEAQRHFYKPDKENYFASDKVIEPQHLLAHLLDNKDLRQRMIASICAHEGTAYSLQSELMELESSVLARVMISGILPDKRMIFPPVPNFIFTRDIGITVNDHILLNKPKKKARTRESIIMKYIFFNHPMFEAYTNNIIEINDPEDFFLLDEEEQEKKLVTIEGGDVMMVAPNHLLVGVSERTSIHAASKVIRTMHERDIVEKVTIVKIPAKRAYMHIDTTFTQVKRNMWVIFGSFSKEGLKQEQGDYIMSLGGSKSENEIEILQYIKGRSYDDPIKFDYLEDLLNDISQTDLRSEEPTQFIYSGDNEFPHGRREQWTDSCNVLALKEGVVIGYDRNDKTSKGFQKQGIEVIRAADLLDKFKNEELHPSEVNNTLILLPSAELSRARGGSHCMSMPLLRTPLW
ncbi:amidinotransferase [Flammeovirga yaeyamensis]|uniref:arginine deiminase n=1 Tax=Flammeovirga yaeyamensis TaxID=367791 RepID=A0AAX1N0K4_9BACT|nr:MULTISPECIES: arginine deiminase family protein [Flammeovirga]ANQ47704.2 amidinotransferase [Flammeovirga sp. MY04]MBB3700168.1 arginine deiminase [Flammeovirga yaeyamensis]NMF37202.1 amidinotransferase [Flammeovirga yaeyamensis]QWG00891.1 amidinotransferase [Flammeovirga yaeyamensis]